MMLVLLIMTAALICLAASAMGREGDWRRWGVVAATAGTVGLVWLGMATAPHQTDGPYGRLRVTLEAISLRIDNGETYTLGGDPVADDVVIAPRAGIRLGRGALPPSVLEMRGGESGIELRPGDHAGPQSLGLVRVRAPDTPDRWLGAAPSPARIACVGGCGSSAQARIDLEDARAYFADTTPASGAGEEAAPSGMVFTTPDGEVFTAGGVVDDVLMLEPGARPVLIDIYEADRGRAPAGDIHGEPGRLTLRRTFFARMRDGRLILTPQTSQSVSIDHAGEEGDRSVLRIAPGSDVNALQGPDERVVGFSLLGRPFASDLAGVMIDAARQSDQPSIVHNQNGRQLGFTERVEIGARRAAIISVRPLDFAGGVYPLVALLTTLSLAIFALATWRIRLADPVAGVAFAAVEFLLAMRLLIAIEGAFVDAAAKAQTSVADAMIAVPLGLLLVLAFHPVARRQRVALGALAVVAISALTAAWAAGLASRAIVVVTAAAALGLMVLVVRQIQSAPSAPPEKAAGDDGHPFGGLWQDPWGLYDDLTRDRPIAVLSAMAVMICLLRAVFALFGWREGVVVGTERIALSLVFVPLTLLAFAPLMARAWRGWSQKADKTLTFGGREFLVSPELGPVVVFNLALLVGVFLASFLARDNGFAIYALPVILASFVVSQHAGQTGRQRLIDAAVAFATGLVIVAAADVSFSAGWSGWILLAVAALAGLLCLVLRPRALWLAPAAAVAAMLLVVNLPFDLAPSPEVSTDLESAVSLEDNDLRLLAALDPQRLADIGTRNAEGLEDTLIHLRSYGDTLLGRGYFNLPDPTVLRAYHLTDNAAAVHLVSPFGRVGAAAFLAVTAALAFIGCWAATRRPDPQPSAWVGALAALTVSSISIYIVLANLLAAPFTGRNVYFLAPWSMADLIEGLMLVSLVLVTLCPREVAADG
jgi:hypothetical protein